MEVCVELSKQAMEEEICRKSDLTLEEVFLKMVGQPPEEAAKLFGASGVAADPEQLDEDEALDPTEESAGPETDEAQTEKTADDGDAAMPDTEAKEGE